MHRASVLVNTAVLTTAGLLFVAGCADDRDTPWGSDAARAEEQTVERTAASAPAGSPTTTTTATAGSGSSTTAPLGTGTSTTAPVAPAASSTTPPVGSTTTQPAPTASSTTTLPATTTTTRPAVLDAAAARAALDRLTGQAVDGYLELPSCPLDPTDGNLTAIVGGLDVEPVAASVAGDTLASVFEVGVDALLELSCDRATEGSEGNAVGLFALAPPADYAALTTAEVNPDGDAAIVVTVTPSASERGGRLERVCVRDADDPEFDYCEVIWVAGDLLVGAYVAGVGATEVDLDAFEAAFAAQLDELIAALAAG